MVNITGTSGAGKTRLAMQWVLQQPAADQSAMVHLDIVSDEAELHARDRADARTLFNRETRQSSASAWDALASKEAWC